jgi:hypothetical protein
MRTLYFKRTLYFTSYVYFRVRCIQKYTCTQKKRYIYEYGGIKKYIQYYQDEPCDMGVPEGGWNEFNINHREHEGHREG